MRVFQTTYRDRACVTHKTQRWYVEIPDPWQRRRCWRIPGFTDRKQTEALGRNIEKLTRAKFARETLDSEMTKWVEGLPPRLTEVLGRIGLLDAVKSGALRPLIEHLEGTADAPGFKQALEGKGATAGHVALTVGRAKSVIEGCGFKFWSDVSAAKVTAHLETLRADTLDAKGEIDERGLSAQTSNYYLRAIRQFARWMVRDGRASESPLAYLSGLNVETDRRHDRRALSVKEARNLLDKTGKAPERYGMTGGQRALLYRVAMETGLRANEIRSLTRASLMLDGPAPTVAVEAAFSKHRRRDVLPLRPDTAAALRAHVAGKMPAAPVFILPSKWRMVDMLKEDLDNAGILYRDESTDRVVDFHALRHTAATLLAGSGVHPKTAQTIMRHGDINLTMSLYTHSLVEQEGAAVAALPDLSAQPAESVRQTGTDDRPALPDAPQRPKSGADTQGRQSGHAEATTGNPAAAAHLAQRLAHEDEKRLAPANQGELVGQEGDGETSPEIIEKGAHLRGYKMARLAGLEPTAYGLEGRCSVQLSYRRPRRWCGLDYSLPAGSRSSRYAGAPPPGGRCAAGPIPLIPPFWRDIRVKLY